MLNISQPILDQIAAQAAREAPLEACGYLAGTGDTAAAVYPLSNMDKSPEHFSFDPRQQFKTIKAARAQGLTILAVYHSHPASPARLSDEDIRLSLDPDVIYLIYSIPEKKLSAFKLTQGKIIDEEIKIGV